mmetsp:Transcript_64057/g.150728  ORF Transcript_64057/g.150728 Transcript_64057/m.150728 type:complete len:109 (+) Transcript_64057:187-513(+)
MVMGLRIWKQIRRDLLEHADGVLLAGKNTRISDDDLEQDFRRISHLKIDLCWRRHCWPVQMQGLMRVAPLMATVVRLDLSSTSIGLFEKGAESIAIVLSKCTAMAILI